MLTAFSLQMIYLYKDPKGDKIFGKTSTSQATSKINTTRTTALTGDQQQQQSSLPLSTLSSDDVEKEELRETIQEKDRIITDLRGALDAATQWYFMSINIIPVCVGSCVITISLKTTFFVMTGMIAWIWG